MLHKLRRLEIRVKKAREEGIAIIMMRGRKRMGGCFKTGSREMGAKMPRVV